MRRLTLPEAKHARRVPASIVAGSVALAIIAATSAVGAEEAPATGRITATILMYSGRPNPTFELDDAAARRLQELISQARPVMRHEGNTVIRSILGYGGILVDNRSGRGPMPTRLAVYRGDVEIHTGETAFLRDDSGAIESFLLAQAVERGVIDQRDLAFIRR